LNSIQANLEDGTIEIKIKSYNNDTVIVFIDSGVGILMIFKIKYLNHYLPPNKK